MPTPGPTRSGLQVRQRSTSRGLALGLRIASSISVGVVIDDQDHDRKSMHIHKKNPFKQESTVGTWPPGPSLWQKLAEW